MPGAVTKSTNYHPQGLNNCDLKTGVSFIFMKTSVLRYGLKKKLKSSSEYMSFIYSTSFA